MPDLTDTEAGKLIWKVLFLLEPCCFPARDERGIWRCTTHGGSGAFGYVKQPNPEFCCTAAVWDNFRGDYCSDYNDLMKALVVARTDLALWARFLECLGVPAAARSDLELLLDSGVAGAAHALARAILESNQGQAVWHALDPHVKAKATAARSTSTPSRLTETQDLLEQNRRKRAAIEAEKKRTGGKLSR